MRGTEVIGPRQSLERVDRPSGLHTPAVVQWVSAPEVPQRLKPLWTNVANAARKRYSTPDGLRVGAGLAQLEIFQHAHALFQQRRTLRNLSIGGKFVDQHGQQLRQVGVNCIG